MAGEGVGLFFATFELLIADSGWIRDGFSVGSGGCLLAGSVWRGDQG